MPRLSGAPVRASDIRAGAALTLAGLVGEGVTHVSDIFHVDRGYPGFDEALRHLGADVTREPDPDARRSTTEPASPELTRWPAAAGALDSSSLSTISRGPSVVVTSWARMPAAASRCRDSSPSMKRARRGDGHHQPVVVGAARARPPLDQRAPLPPYAQRSSSASTPTDDDRGDQRAPVRHRPSLAHRAPVRLPRP